MMIEYSRLFILLLLGLVWSPAAPCQNQQGVILEFQLVVNGEELVLGSDYQIADRSVTIDLFRFYISEVRLCHQDEPIWQEQESYHLVDASDPASLLLVLPYSGELAFGQLKMQLGIDSATHDLGAMSGDLDPTKGMYWSWQSGYINFKLEGRSPESSRRNNEFQYHLGGYQSPSQTAREIVLEVETTDKMVVNIDLGKFLESVNLADQPMVMSPGKQASDLSDVAVSMFE